MGRIEPLGWREGRTWDPGIPVLLSRKAEEAFVGVAIESPVVRSVVFEGPDPSLLVIAEKEHPPINSAVEIDPIAQSQIPEKNCVLPTAFRDI